MMDWRKVMDSDPMSINLNQPTLFDFTGSSSGTVELFPTVWSAAEELTSPDPEFRARLPWNVWLH